MDQFLESNLEKISPEFCKFEELNPKWRRLLESIAIKTLNLLRKIYSIYRKEQRKVVKNDMDVFIAGYEARNLVPSWETRLRSTTSDSNPVLM